MMQQYFRFYADARYWYSKSVRLFIYPSVCLSVRNVPVSDENGLTYRHSFYRAMHMHKRGICCHPVSVRLSVRHVRELPQNE